MGLRAASCFVLLVLAACGSTSSPVVEKRCGDSRSRIFSAHDAGDVAELTGCTVLVGRFQQDSVSDLRDFAGLESVQRIEGALNVFRSPGFTSLRGLDNLETVDGDLFIHLNPNLTSLAGLAKLRVVTGKLYVRGNDILPQSELDALAARVSVGGKKTVEP